MSKKTCKTCSHNVKDWICTANSDRYCDNPDSDHYGYNTRYITEKDCEAWEAKNG